MGKPKEWSKWAAQRIFGAQGSGPRNNSDPRNIGGPRNIRHREYAQESCVMVDTSHPDGWPKEWSQWAAQGIIAAQGIAAA
eukprot:CAMPEP_0196654794 /NCGR_PEP_ID=MMETSP1086-20130531/4527_1 /TAXON_ID=77921 /ORGANISM="Cyanoptyche  gloeocystis , Strain SAG4.97" /LENGTH=80 /DNA_ID=CAMNT_0041986757 /DNA_START=307 /DNA_END=546 /DNA_ORIENTATION=-